MEYRARIEFASGEGVQLIELRQLAHYEGLLEGLPTREMNARYLDGLRRTRPEVRLIPPLETPIEWSEARAYPFGTPSALPPVLCEARFRGRDDDPLYVREASVAWFQSTWAFPIDEAILTALRALDWLSISSRHEI